MVHGLDEIIRIRMLMIAAAYEDGDDAADLRSHPTISRFENLPDACVLLRMGRAMVDHNCRSCRQVPHRIVLDIDHTFDAAHGGKQLRLFNADYDEYSLQPIVGLDDAGRMVAAVLVSGRSAKRRRDRPLAGPADHGDPRQLAPCTDHVTRQQPLL